jgi:hypothetical protein
MYSVSVRASRVFVLAVSAATLGFLTSPVTLSQPAVAEPASSAPIEVGAVYKITLNGFDVGNLRYRSRVTGKSYSLDSDIELSALLGAFHWTGSTRTSGAVSGSALRPASYDFQFKSNAKSGSIHMGFDANGVNQLTVAPDAPLPPDTVPLQQGHAKSVLDPLSAILAITRIAGTEPCGRRLAIFDGKQRFDLSFIYRRLETIAPSSSGGPASEGIVCRVKYSPIAGYRDTADTKAMAQNAGIEIAFRPVQNAGMMVPYRVTLPTMAGPVSIEAQRIDVNAPAAGQIAFVD